ncbi:hypothetical protein [Pseudomonas luteola]|uniref:Uncharacterized protein n=1 Tax=Pseudomonas luteola TaxID=47886 RepID=A0ABS0FS57_PSELU|nr:hypothetical protein [Pseudomonas zeshuii]MBF8643121.1 hypothetical protein [Pseudomonas zeshuii]
MYLLACSIMMAASITYQFNLIFTGKLAQRAEYMALLLIATALMAAPVLMTIFTGFMAARGNPITMGSGKLVIWLALAGSILVAGIGAFKLRGLNRRSSFSAVGFAVMPILIGLVSAIAVVKQLSFMDENSAMVNYGAIKQMAEITDMPDCKSDIVLAHYEYGKPVVYRCPKAYVLNALTSNPFVPWPDYIEGTSVQLGQAMDQFNEQAKNEQ